MRHPAFAKSVITILEVHQHYPPTIPELSCQYTFAGKSAGSWKSCPRISKSLRLSGGPESAGEPRGGFSEPSWESSVCETDEVFANDKGRTVLIPSPPTEPIARPPQRLDLPQDLDPIEEADPVLLRQRLHDI